MRIVLGNPPAARPTMRDYYCSSSSKAAYVWQPIDLLIQAAWLRRDHDLLWRDFAVRPAPRGAAPALLRDDRPDVVIGLVGAAAPDDFGFWRQVHGETGARMFLSGDLARFDVAGTLDANPWLEGVLTDFTTPGIANALRGEAPGPGLARRGETPTDARGPFAYPLPPHEMVWALPYRHPFLPPGFATVMTDFGCPHRCRYCNSGALGWRPRDPGNLVDELRWLAAHNRRALFIKDMTFNADPARTLGILGMLREMGPWRFACYLRPDRVTTELAVALRRAGCAMAMVGLESGDMDVLAAVRPTAELTKSAAGVQHLHDAGVPVGGHFLLGLPGESANQLERTVEMARRLPLAYASFNLASPRIGTPLFAAGSGVADGSAAATRLLADRIDAATLLRARRRAIRRFYLRPSYLARQLAWAVRDGMLWRRLRHGAALIGRS